MPDAAGLADAAPVNASTEATTPSALRLRPIWAIESPLTTSKVTLPEPGPG